MIPRIIKETNRSFRSFMAITLSVSYDPTPLDISQAHEEESYGENNQQCEIDRHGHHISNTEGSMENVSAVGRRKHVGKRPEKNRQTFNREE